MDPPAMTDPLDRCPRCDRPSGWCVCDKIVAIPTRTQVVILQHPQERDKDLGTAGIVTAMLPRAVTHVGLSWSSLEHALGQAVEPKRWGVLYTGPLPTPLPPEMHRRPAVILSRKGTPREEVITLEGIIALDGSWSQAKTLWWRNAWLLKLPRVVLHPKEPGIYGRMRKEPRPEALSTLEAIALALVANGENPETGESLRRVFRTMVQRARDHTAQTERKVVRPKVDRRRRRVGDGSRAPTGGSRDPLDPGTNGGDGAGGED